MSGEKNQCNQNNPPNHRSRLRVLLVDDEPMFLEVLAKRLGRRGMYVTTAKNGSEGIQMLRKHDFDAAVVDLKMEETDGLEVLKIFKKMCPEMPVIILTGHGAEQSVGEAYAMGAFDYLSKPCDLEELTDRITRATGR